jgi:hypothetical protein
MPRFTFKVNEEFRTVDARDLEDAFEQADLKDSDCCELVRSDDLDDIRILSAINDDDMLFDL